jgi:hypothetical protein
MDRALRVAQSSAGEGLSLPHGHAASALAHPLDLPQHSLAARDLPAGDHPECRRREAARHPHWRYRRGVERTRPHRAAGLRHRALHAGRGGGVRGRLDGPRRRRHRSCRPRTSSPWTNLRPPVPSPTTPSSAT